MDWVVRRRRKKSGGDSNVSSKLMEDIDLMDWIQFFPGLLFGRHILDGGDMWP